MRTVGQKIMAKAKKKFTFPKIKFTFNKNKEMNRSSVILIKGSLLTCIILSIASGFIDLAFFSGLSKSLLHLGTFPLYAAILYTLISIGFISAKFWCAMKIGMIKELQARLEARSINWAYRLNRAIIPWHIAHKFLIAVSILTALSLSVNSIGAGIRTMEQNINNMQKDAELLLELNKSVNDGQKDNRSAKKDNISGQLTAQQNVVANFDNQWKYVEDYRKRRDALNEERLIADEDRVKEIDTEITRLRRDAANKAPEGVTFNNIEYVDEYTIKNQLLSKAKSFEVIDSSSYIEEGIAYDQAQIEDTIRALIDKEYKFPNGEPINFMNEDGSLVNVQLAISRLQNGIAHWQNDTGDVGESSKIFTMISVYINADAKAGGMGVSEWMMMIFIAIAGIVQEFLIALFTPKATIDRKLLSQVSQYLLWENKEQKERFLISVYTDYVGDGIINEEDFNFKCAKCVSLMEQSEDDIILKYSKKAKEAAKKEKEKTQAPVITTITAKSPIVKKEQPTAKAEIPVRPAKVEEIKKEEVEPQYSSAVDDLISEIEGLV